MIQSVHWPEQIILQAINDPLSMQGREKKRTLVCAVNELCKRKQTTYCLQYAGTQICSICNQYYDENGLHELISPECLHNMHYSCAEREIIKINPYCAIDISLKCAICGGQESVEFYTKLLGKKKVNEMHDILTARAIAEIVQTDLLDEQLRLSEVGNKSFTCVTCTAQTKSQVQGEEFPCGHRLCEQCVQQKYQVGIQWPHCPYCQLSQTRTLQEELSLRLIIEASTLLYKYVLCPKENRKQIYRVHQVPVNDLVAFCSFCDEHFCTKGCPQQHRGETCAEFKARANGKSIAVNAENVEVDASLVGMCPDCRCFAKGEPSKRICRCSCGFEFCLQCHKKVLQGRCMCM